MHEEEERGALKKYLTLPSLKVSIAYEEYCFNFAQIIKNSDIMSLYRYNVDEFVSSRNSTERAVWFVSFQLFQPVLSIFERSYKLQSFKSFGMEDNSLQAEIKVTGRVKFSLRILVRCEIY